MDVSPVGVTAARLDAVSPTPARPRPDQVTPVARASAEATATTTRAPAGAPSAHERPPGLSPEERPLRNREREIADPEGGRSDHLKFDVASADVLARFQIDEETRRVKITMYQRDTGELICELPPRGVQDVIDALGHGGLAVDASS